MRRAALHALALLAAVLVAWVGSCVLNSASPIPFGDESAHLRKLFELQKLLGPSPSALESFNRIMLSGDAYPNALYAMSLPMLGGLPDITAARGVTLLLSAIHAWTALVLGHRLWGRPAALGYVLLACLSPIVLAHHATYTLDGALASMVGICFIVCERTSGFQKRAMTVFLIVAAAATLLVKWTALVWLLVPVAWQCLHGAWLSGRTPRERLMASIAIAGTAAGNLAVIAMVSRSDWAQGWRPDQPDAWGPLVTMMVVTGLSMVLVVFARSAHTRAMLALTAISAIAGPWYALRMPFLLDRLTHEASTGIPSLGPSEDHLGMYAESLRLLVPFGEVWVLLALVWTARRHSALPWTRVVALGLAVGLTVRFLPFNIRYLLPAAPVAAGVAVSLFGGWRRAAQWCGAGAIAAISATLVLAPLPSDPLPYTWSTQRVSVSFPVLARGIGSPPAPMTQASVTTLLDTLEATCRGRCQAHLTPSELGIQARAIKVLAMTRGLDVSFDGPCSGPEIPLEGIAQTFTVCFDDR